MRYRKSKIKRERELLDRSPGVLSKIAAKIITYVGFLGIFLMLFVALFIVVEAIIKIIFESYYITLITSFLLSILITKCIYSGLKQGNWLFTSIPRIGGGIKAKLLLTISIFLTFFIMLFGFILIGFSVSQILGLVISTEFHSLILLISSSTIAILFTLFLHFIYIEKASHPTFHYSKVSYRRIKNIPLNRYQKLSKKDMKKKYHEFIISFFVVFFIALIIGLILRMPLIIIAVPFIMLFYFLYGEEYAFRCPNCKMIYEVEGGMGYIKLLSVRRPFIEKQLIISPILSRVIICPRCNKEIELELMIKK